MPARKFNLINLVATLALLVLSGVQPTAAKSQLTVPIASQALLPKAVAQQNITALAAGGGQTSPPPASAPASARSFDQLPLYFVENRGQTDPRVAFYVPGRDQTLYFTPAGVTFAFTAPLTPTATLPAGRTGGEALPGRGAPGRAPQAAQRWAVKLDFVGANPNVHPVGQSQTGAVFSYFKGKPDQWHFSDAQLSNVHMMILVFQRQARPVAHRPGHLRQISLLQSVAGD